MRVDNTIFVAALALALALASPDAGANEDQQQESKGGVTATVPDTDLGTAGAVGADLQPADETASQEMPVSASPPPVPTRPIYKPPSPGKPVRTVGGGSRSRGTGERIPKLFALTPEHVGQTIADQPSLFWFIDRVSPDMQVEFVLLEADAVEPLVETTLATPTRAGIQRIRLADYGVELAPGAEYEWSVTLVVDPEKRSQDIVAAGWIDRVEPSGQLAAQLETLDPGAVAAAYAEAGLWYDTITALSDEIERSPEDPLPVRQRADVLRQVGLVEAAGTGS